MMLIANIILYLFGKSLNLSNYKQYYNRYKIEGNLRHSVIWKSFINIQNDWQNSIPLILTKLQIQKLRFGDQLTVIM